MIFLTSLVYAVVFWPLEPLLMALAGMVPRVPSLVTLAVLNLVLYLLVLSLVRAARMLYVDFDLGEKKADGVRLHDWLEVNRCRWLNVLGLLSISAGATAVFQAGRMPPSFWFLYGAIILGLLDLVKPNRLVSLVPDCPAPCFDPGAVTVPTKEAGRQAEFVWWPWVESGEAPRECRATFVIDEEAYRQARELARLPADRQENYLRYVRDGFTSSVQQVAAYFRQQSREKGFVALQEVANVVCFVRSIPYATDTAAHGVAGYVQYPVETLHDQRGDGEDHAILAACLLHYLGHDVGLFFLQFDQDGHVALAYNSRAGSGPFAAMAANGKAYYYVETAPTVETERVGEVSEAFLARLRECRVMPVE